MKFEDLEVGMEVFVLRSGSRKNLASAEVEQCTVLRALRWTGASSDEPWPGVPVVGPDGTKVTVRGWRSPVGKKVPVLPLRESLSNYADLIAPALILGPVEEWQAKVESARVERAGREAARLADQQTMEALCADIYQRLEAAGIVAEARVSMKDRCSIEIGVHGIESAERLVAMVEAASPGEDGA